jgi:hypothetical protein
MNQQVSLPPAYLLVLAETVFFDPEDGGDMFLRNVGCNSTDYTASHPWRWYSSTVGMFILYSMRYLSQLRSHNFVSITVSAVTNVDNWFWVTWLWSCWCWAPEACFLISFSPLWDIVYNLLHTLQNTLELSSGSCFYQAYKHSLWKIYILLGFSEIILLSCKNYHNGKKLNVK